MTSRKPSQNTYFSSAQAAFCFPRSFAYEVGERARKKEQAKKRRGK